MFSLVLSDVFKKTVHLCLDLHLDLSCSHRLFGNVLCAFIQRLARLHVTNCGFLSAKRGIEERRLYISGLISTRFVVFPFAIEASK